MTTTIEATSNRNAAQAAWRAATLALIQAHSAEHAAMHEQERVARGLPAVSINSTSRTARLKRARQALAKVQQRIAALEATDGS